VSVKDPEEVREIFEHFDRDGNGFIDKKEWRKLLEALDSGFTDEEAKIGLREVDKNGNGKIELEEFMKWWNEQP
jgi:Ca2+-binding EF-hand superfamily protein